MRYNFGKNDKYFIFLRKEVDFIRYARLNSKKVGKPQFYMLKESFYADKRRTPC